MLNSRTAFEEAIRHFPRWMNIRKRKDTSSGGNYLQSLVQELDEVQSAIEDYTKDFFIINYIGKEETVIDYLYVAEVGETSIHDITILSPINNVTGDVKAFHNSKEPIVLYQGGRLSIKPRDLGNHSRIKYSRNGFTYTAELNKVHIWNVIDEFALYAGIERYENELNESLLKRCLLVFTNKANSTEDGMKNAIMNAISGLAHVDQDEIVIEKPKASNLFKKDSESQEVIEKLAQLNQDTYRTKKWDESRWEHPFKTIEYISPEWDKEPEDIQDGVGQNDSLKASLLSDLEEGEMTDITIDLYEKSDIRINEYVRDHRLEVDLGLQLKKFKNTLKPKEVEYKIVAAEATDLTNSNVYIDCHRVTEGENTHYVSDMVANSDDVKDITIERGKLQSGKRYKLRFTPKKEYSQMYITKARTESGENRHSLLKEKSPFTFNKDGVLINSNVKLHAKSTHDFKSFDNIRNLRDGFTLADATKDGKLAIDVSGMAHQYVRTEVRSRETSIIRDKEFVKADDRFIMNDSNQLVSTQREGDVVIELKCNQLFYAVESGNCIVTKIIDGEQFPSEIWYEAKSEQLRFDESKDVRVIIRKLNNDTPLIISSVRYARYDVELTVEKGSFIRTPLGAVIPSTPEDKNTLHMTIRTYSGFSPEVSFVHIGSSLSNAAYETDIFTAGANTYIDFDANCDVALIEVNAAGQVLSTKEKFVAKNLYRNTRSSVAYLQIDTSGFASIRRSVPAIDRFSYQGRMSNWIRIEPGQEIDTILIDGNIRTLIDRVYITDLLKKNAFDKIYANRRLKGFVVQSGSEEKLIRLSREDIGGGADSYSVHNLPYGARGAFIVDGHNNVESIGTTHSQAFESFYVFPANTQEHVAYNRVSMLRPEITSVDIVDMFSPIVPQNKLMVYVLEPVVKQDLKADVAFEKGNTHADWSLGRKTLRVQIEIDQELSDNYGVEQLAIQEKFVLSNNINLEEQIEVNGERVNIGEYVVIPPEGMRVIHENRSSQPERLYVEEDGFNKLQYSNIVLITSIRKASGGAIPASSYSLLNEEGIVAWTDNSLAGEEVIIEYRYGVPRYITFTDIEKMYALVGHNVEAYRFQTSLHYRDTVDSTPIRDNDIDRIRTADRVIASSSNPNFRVRLENNVIRLTKLNEEDYIAIKAGFFYQDGQELYHFANRSENLLERMSNVELIDTQRLAGALRMNQHSRNYLPDSSMYPRRSEIVSIADFAQNKKIKGLSKLDALTACDSYSKWNTFEMDMSFVPGLNGLGMRFEPLDPSGYAMMDITQYLKSQTILSLYADGNPHVFIAKERKHQRHSFNKSIYAEPFKDLTNREEFKFFVFEEVDDDYKYYLVVRGSGVIDDVVIKDYVKEESLRSIHTKEINALGLDIKEHASVDYIQSLLFDSTNNRLDRLEVSQDGFIQTGTNADWGFTKIQEYKNNWNNCVLKEVDLVKDAYIKSSNREGSIETDDIYVRNPRSLRSMIVKINELLFSQTEGFRIEVLTAASPQGRYSMIAVGDNTNTLIVPHNRLSNYIKVKVDMPSNKVITNIEVYSEFIETTTPLRIGEYENGELTTKVYDSGFSKHYAVKQFVAGTVERKEDIEFSVRAFRQEGDRLVWTDWKDLKVNDSLEVTNQVEFEDYRYFQFKVVLRNEKAKVQIESIELEVIR